MKIKQELKSNYISADYRNKEDYCVICYRVAHEDFACESVEIKLTVSDKPFAFAKAYQVEKGYYSWSWKGEYIYIGIKELLNKLFPDASYRQLYTIYVHCQDL